MYCLCSAVKISFPLTPPSSPLSLHPLPLLSPSPLSLPSSDRTHHEVTFGTPEEQEVQNIFKDAFWHNGDPSLALPAGGTKTLLVHCLPFSMGTHTCQVRDGAW